MTIFFTVETNGTGSRMGEWFFPFTNGFFPGQGMGIHQVNIVSIVNGDYLGVQGSLVQKNHSLFTNGENIMVFNPFSLHEWREYYDFKTIPWRMETIRLNCDFFHDKKNVISS